jgi:predicted amidohydrolase
MFRGAAVRARWIENFDPDLSDEKRRYGEHLNLLIIPWPFVITQSQFRPVLIERVSQMAPRCRYFAYKTADTDSGFARRVRELIEKATAESGKVCGVVFPELALTPEQYSAVRDELMGLVDFVICGICNEPDSGGHGENYAQVCTLVSAIDRLATEIRQDKHHRWFLEDRQIQRYGLSTMLDPGKIWWESTSVKPRTLSFVALESWLTFSVLICEDLARPDPVGEMLRAVGPNLVIALLLDGPQVRGRWSERFATVLADDPGCSVLSVTSFGMMQLGSGSRTSASRSVALWKDPSALAEIELPEGAEAVLISLSSSAREEWSADGRGDRETAAFLRLVGVRGIKAKKSLSVPVSSPAKSNRKTGRKAAKIVRAARKR